MCQLSSELTYHSALLWVTEVIEFTQISIVRGIIEAWIEIHEQLISNSLKGCTVFTIRCW